MFDTTKWVYKHLKNKTGQIQLKHRHENCLENEFGFGMALLFQVQSKLGRTRCPGRPKYKFYLIVTLLFPTILNFFNKLQLLASILSSEFELNTILGMLKAKERGEINQSIRPINS
jgi:hypothetical protein